MVMKNLHCTARYSTTHSNTHPQSSLPVCRWLLLACLAALVSACSTTGDSQSGRYAMSKDAPPGDGVTLDPDNIPDAVPIFEPRTAAGNKTPYTVLGETYEVMPESKGYQEEGKVSWYGKKFHGYKTSNGETYDMYKMSAAHKTLPIPSYVRVTNLANGRTGIVRVNDRGPFHSERIMDLSYAAAVKLGVVQSGTATVRLETIEPSSNAYAKREADRDTLPVASKKGSHRKAATPAVREIASTTPVEDALPQTTPVASGNTYLQAGAFRNQDAAMALREKLANLVGRPVNVDSLQGYYKVRIGPLEDDSDARNVADLMVQYSYARPMVVYF